MRQPLSPQEMDDLVEILKQYVHTVRWLEGSNPATMSEGAKVVWRQAGVAQRIVLEGLWGNG